MIMVENLPTLSGNDRKRNMFRCPHCRTKKRYVNYLPRSAKQYSCKQCSKTFIC